MQLNAAARISQVLAAQSPDVTRTKLRLDRLPQLKPGGAKGPNFLYSIVGSEDELEDALETLGFKPAYMVEHGLPKNNDLWARTAAGQAQLTCLLFKGKELQLFSAISDNLKRIK